MKENLLCIVRTPYIVYCIRSADYFVSYYSAIVFVLSHHILHAEQAEKRSEYATEKPPSHVSAQEKASQCENYIKISLNIKRREEKTWVYAFRARANKCAFQQNQNQRICQFSRFIFPRYKVLCHNTTKQENEFAFKDKRLRVLAV